MTDISGPCRPSNIRLRSFVGRAPFRQRPKIPATVKIYDLLADLIDDLEATRQPVENYFGHHGGHPAHEEAPDI